MPRPPREQFHLKCDSEFADWLRDISQACRTPIPTLIEQALAHLADHRGWAPPPPRIGKPERTP